MNLKWFVGWLPAFILPVSTILQLLKLLHSKKGENVSLLAWFLFGLANIGAYVFSEKYASIQSILAFLLTAFLDFVIVFVLVYYKKNK